MSRIKVVARNLGAFGVAVLMVVALSGAHVHANSHEDEGGNNRCEGCDCCNSLIIVGCPLEHSTSLCGLFGCYSEHGEEVGTHSGPCDNIDP
jgi:hypothetical protein